MHDGGGLGRSACSIPRLAGPGGLGRGRGLGRGVGGEPCRSQPYQTSPTPSHVGINATLEPLSRRARLPKPPTRFSSRRQSRSLLGPTKAASSDDVVLFQVSHFDVKSNTMRPKVRRALCREALSVEAAFAFGPGSLEPPGAHCSCFRGSESVEDA